MPRRAAGPRLYLRKGRIDRRSGKALPDVWVIRDGAVEISTGCDADRLRGAGGAEGRLNLYLAEKFAAPAPRLAGGDEAARRRDPAQVLIAEVLAAYTLERAPRLKLDGPTAAAMIRNLTAWWADRPLTEVRRSTCKAYLEHRQAQPDARYTRDPASAPLVSERTASRELDILGGAVAWWHGEDTLTTRPVVWRPEPPESNRDALTRAQAARLLMAARGYRLGEDGRWTRRADPTRTNRTHLRRFILIGLYTGSRPGVIQAGLWEESATQPWADLDAAVIFRRGREVREQRSKRTPIVKIPRRLLAHLKRWRAADLKRGADITAIVHYAGDPIVSGIRRGFAGCVADAGLPDGVTPHWLRHTAATWLMEADADPWDAAGYLGMTMATLEKCYGHHRPSYQAAVAAKAGRRA